MPSAKRSRIATCITVVAVVAALGLISQVRDPFQRAQSHSQPNATITGTDCRRDGNLTANDIRIALRVAIGIRPLSDCPALDTDGNKELSTDERLAAAPNETMRRYWRKALEWSDTNPPVRENAVVTWIRSFLATEGFPGAGDVLMRNAVITAKYAGWYRARPDLFKWAGCAAFVSQKVGLGLAPYKFETLADRLVDKNKLNDEPIRLAALDLLRSTNTAVYHDLAWAHEAYLDGGLAAVEAGLEGVPDQLLKLEGFRAIDAGARLAQTSTVESEEAIWHGNMLLLRHEQSGIIQDQLGLIDQVSARLLSKVIAIDFSGEVIPEEASMAMFQRAMMRHGRLAATITRFTDRWLWVEDEIIPTWRRLDQEKRAMIMERAEALTHLPWSLLKKD